MSTQVIRPSVSPLRAVSYLRVSTNQQARRAGEPEGLSIPAQREACRRRALEMGAFVVSEFVERGRSGTSLERPELKRMLDHIQTQPVDFVIVHKIDRLARNRADDAAVTNQIPRDRGAADLDDRGHQQHSVGQAAAWHYGLDRGVLLTQPRHRGDERDATEGDSGRHPRPCAVGYLNQRVYDRDTEIRTVVVDPDRGPHITWAFHAYASGEWSLSKIVAELNARGLTTKPGPNTPARPVTIRSLHHLLPNPYYAGVVTFNEVEHPGAHEPLVDPVTWATVQDMLAARSNGERSRTHDHYLKGTVYCIGCGRRLILQHTRGNKDCTQRKALPIAQVERRVADVYRTITLNTEQRAKIEDVALKNLRRQHTHDAERLSQLRTEANTIESHRGKLLEAYYADAVPHDLFLREQRRLKAEHARLEHERKTAATGLADLEQRTREALDLLHDAHQTYQRASEPIRKQLNHALFARILLGYDPSQIEIEFNKPYDTLAAPQNGTSQAK